MRLKEKAVSGSGKLQVVRDFESQLHLILDLIYGYLPPLLFVHLAAASPALL